MTYRRGMNPPMFINPAKAAALLRQSIPDRADHMSEEEKKPERPDNRTVLLYHKLIAEADLLDYEIKKIKPTDTGFEVVGRWKE